MRVLALDHGTKRIGLAISDPTATIGQPLGYWPAAPFSKFLDQLKTLIQEKEVSLIVVGMPRNMDGSYGPAAQKAQEFLEAIRSGVALPVRAWDERLTSVQANRLLIEGGVRREQRKQKVDALAAAVLLQSFLDSRDHASAQQEPPDGAAA